MEVEQQSGAIVTQLQVRQELRLVNRDYLRHRFQLQSTTAPVMALIAMDRSSLVLCALCDLRG